LNGIEIDGFSVDREEFPASPEELSHTMRQAFEADAAMIPVGGATKLHLGNPPRAAHIALHTSGLRGVVEYEPDNMTVSVLSGTPLAELQSVLRGSQQFLPLDPPHPERATLGGIVSCNSSGPIRFRYGTVRDMLIGVKIAHPDGTRTKAGGKLVKNVTGYDMCKLYTGSLGTLGVLTELTFKVQPLCDALATVLIAYPSIDAALEAAQQSMKSGLLPDAMEAWNREALQAVPYAAASSGSPWVLMLRFGEVDAAVRWQVDKLKEMVQGSPGEILNTLSTEESEQFWEKAASARDAPFPGEEALVKCSVLYQSAAETARQMQEAGQRLGARTSLFCHAGTFILYARYLWTDSEPGAADEVRQVFQDLRRQTTSAGGHAVIEKIRPEVKNAIDVWGYEAPALEIMRRIKREFDPKGLLNPGRFVGGI